MADNLNNQKPSNSNKTGNGPLWIAFVASGIYLCIYYWLFTRTNACGHLFPDYEFSPTLLAWFTGQLACLSANELGDLLAGAFAPLAFLWLVATVLIQTFELRAQREDLNLTRQEMAASTSQLKAQTKLFEEEQAMRRTTTADEEYRRLIAKLEILLTSVEFRIVCHARNITHDPSIKGHRVAHTLRIFSKPPLSENRLELTSFHHALNHYIKFQKTNNNTEISGCRCKNTAQLQNTLSKLIGFLHELILLQSEISAPLKIDYGRCNWEHQKEKASNMLIEINAFPVVDQSVS